MTQFASKTPEAAGLEPRPYRFYFSGLSLPASAIEDWPYCGNHVYLDVANQWHGVGTNPPNPILTYFRSFLEGRTGEDFRQEVGSLLDAVEDAVGYEEAEIDHARAVLERLARVRAL